MRHNDGSYDRGFGPYRGAPDGQRGGYGGQWAREEEEFLVDRSRQSAIYGPARYGLGPYHDRLRRRRRDDSELKQEIEEALFYDTWVDADAITIEVQDGIVTLRGELPSYEEVRYATDDAWDVDGVRGVRSELSVGED
jgi:hypothetical protein